MRYILFDFDGTLVDTGGDITAAANRLLETYDRPPLDRAEVLTHVGDGASELVKGLIPGLPTTEETLALEKFRAFYWDFPIDHAQPYPGMVELLQELPRGSAAVVSNKPEGITKEVIRALDLEQYFATILGAIPERPVKPDPAALLLAMSRLGCQPEQTAMVGDGWQDMASARTAGCHAMGVSWGFHGTEILEEWGAQQLVTKPAEIMEWWRNG